MIIRAAFTVLVIGLCCLAGCGFGGFSGPANSGSGGTGSQSVSERVIEGVAAKGHLQNGTIRVYGVNSDGTLGILLNTVETDAAGAYQINIKYNGVVLVQATGSYIDEATGNTLVLDDAMPLRAVVTNQDRVARVAVTPLTELAVRKALVLTKDNVEAANSQISAIFKVDVLTTLPEQLTAQAFGNAATSQEQKDYSLALAAVSRLAMGEGSLVETMRRLEAGIGSASMDVATAGRFRAALVDYLKSSANGSGVTDLSQTNLGNVGGGVVSVRLVVDGTLLAGETISGLYAMLSLPEGVSIRTDFATMEPLSGMVKTSGVTPPNSFCKVKCQPQGGTGAAISLALASQSGFALGEVATIICDLPPGRTLEASQIGISSQKIYTGSGAVMPGVSLSVKVD